MFIATDLQVERERPKKFMFFTVLLLRKVFAALRKFDIYICNCTSITDIFFQYSYLTLNLKNKLD